MTDEFQIVDLRENYFKVSNRIFNEDLDIYEIGVYSVLCRFANNDSSESFPSLTKICEMTKISRPKVIKVLTSLAEKEIIIKKKGHLGKSNRYYLMSLPSKRELLVNTINHGSKPHLPPSKPGLPEVVNEVYSKKTNLKKLNKKTNLKRHAHGEYKNVLLTDKQYTSLVDEFTEPVISHYIENMSSWQAKNGKSYKNYLAAIKDWIKRDKETKTTQKPNNQKSWGDLWNEMNQQ